MVEQATEEKKYWHGYKEFPILYEDMEIRVFKNPSNEIFVENRRSGLQMRIKAESSGEFIFITNGVLDPIQINNTIGWRVD
jgi:hypothetical protein